MKPNKPPLFIMSRKPTGRPTGRQPNPEYDAMEKPCIHCSGAIRLRAYKNLSLSKFKEKKFCSDKCAREYVRIENRFARSWVHMENGCHEWIGCTTSNGYGSINSGPERLRAHRYAYEVAHGKIPEGLMVLHSCDNRKCVNLAHLRLGTAKDNANDASSRNRWRPRGLPMRPKVQGVA